MIRQNEKGIVYGITYVDHQIKCVHNGSDLPVANCDLTFSEQNGIIKVSISIYFESLEEL